jgi:hypothetical protein
MSISYFNKPSLDLHLKLGYVCQTNKKLYKFFVFFAKNSEVLAEKAFQIVILCLTNFVLLNTLLYKLGVLTHQVMTRLNNRLLNWAKFD